MQKFANYLKQTLGLTIEESDKQPAVSLQLFLTDLYKVHNIRISGIEFVAVRPQEDSDLSVQQFRKHLSMIENAYQCPSILLLDKIDAQRRRTLVDAKQSFVVPNKQLYIPQLAVSFREEFPIRSSRESLRPNTQMIFFYMLYSSSPSFSASTLVERLGVSKMAVSRAGQELEQLGLVQRAEDGKRTILCRQDEPRRLFEKATPYLICPYRTQKGVREPSEVTYQYAAGLDALSQYTMLSSPKVRCFAVWENSVQEHMNTLHPATPDDSVKVQLWRYDPSPLAYQGRVDPLSLAVSLRAEKDPRIEGEIEDLLESVWEGKYEWN